jgi:hypothetical protein
MVHRLLLDLVSGGPVLKLSKPTVAVETAAEADLLFNVGSSGYSGILLSGTVPFASFSVSTASNFYGFSNYYRCEIPFGRTFASAPKVQIAVNDPILGAGYFGPKYKPSNISFDNVGGTGLHGNQVDIGAESFVDKIALYMQRTYYDGTAYPYPANMSYVVYFT